jgi:hypothetical protein
MGTKYMSNATIVTRHFLAVQNMVLRIFVAMLTGAIENQVNDIQWYKLLDI